MTWFALKCAVFGKFPMGTRQKVHWDYMMFDQGLTNSVWTCPVEIPDGLIPLLKVMARADRKTKNQCML